MESSTNYPKLVVCTTVNPPSEGLTLFSRLRDSVLVVVLDLKSPGSWELENALILDVHKQQKLDFRLAATLPFGSYSRKMLGYLIAMENNAQVIIDTDDDNIPLGNYDFPDFSGELECTRDNLGFVNIYKHFSDKHVWPRGFPVQLVSSSGIEENILANVEVGVWQGLVNGDPDVDAIYRMIFNDTDHSWKPINLALGFHSLCPFNSQNTVFRRILFPLLYLPVTVSMRFSDILRGLVAQPIMWLYGYRLGFCAANVKQVRNHHEVMQDFELELQMYRDAKRVPEIVSEFIEPYESICDNLKRAYRGLVKKGIVGESEIDYLIDWINDISALLQN